MDYIGSFRFEIINTTLVLCGEISTEWILVIHSNQNLCANMCFICGLSCRNHSRNIKYLEISVGFFLLLFSMSFISTSFISTTAIKIKLKCQPITYTVALYTVKTEPMKYTKHICVFYC